jgi:two-component system chemotaxis response regulator CheY
MRLLIVDDSLVIRRKIEREVLLPGLTALLSARDGVEALRVFTQHRPELVTMDLTMPAMEGTECVRRMVALKPDTLILVVSALADKATAIKAIKHGARGFLCKPFSDEALNNALAKMVAYAKRVPA